MPKRERDREGDNEYDILKLENKIDRLTEIGENTREDVRKIKETVFNPQEGLYARLRSLESWKATSSRIIWIMVTVIIGLLGRITYNQITEPKQAIIMPSDLVKMLKENKTSRKITKEEIDNNKNMTPADFNP